MGRNKIKIEKIENTRIRQVTFYKRKKGLIKKSMELSLLCEAKILLCVLDKNEKLTTYVSDSETLKDFEEYFFNKNILKENFNNKDYKELFQGTGKNNNSNDSKSGDFDIENFKNESLKEKKFINFNETLNIASNFGAFDDKRKVKDNSVNEGIFNFFNKMKGKSPISSNYACESKFDKLNDFSFAQFPNQKVNLENSLNKDLIFQNEILNNDDANTLNLNNLLINYLNTNPTHISDSNLALDQNPIYSYLTNFINSGKINPEHISLLMNNLNEIIKNNLNKNNGLISLNQENVEFKDQQANLIEIASRINESKKNLSSMNFPNEINYNSLMQNILLNQQNQISFPINSNLSTNNNNDSENLTAMLKNFQNSNELLAGINPALPNNNIIFDNFKRELNNNPGNNMKNNQLNVINNNNNQLLNNKLNSKDKNSSQEANKNEDFNEKNLNGNKQDLVNKKRKRDEMTVKNEGIESFKEMFFKEKMSKHNQNYSSSNNANHNANLNLTKNLSNQNLFENIDAQIKNTSANFQINQNERKNSAHTNLNSNSSNFFNNNNFNNGYLTDNPIHALSQNIRNTNRFGNQNQLPNEVPINNLDCLKNLSFYNNFIPQNSLNFNNPKMNQLNHSLYVPQNFDSKGISNIGNNINPSKINDLNTINMNNKSNLNTNANNNFLNQAENLIYNFNNINTNNNKNESNAIEDIKLENTNNLNIYQQQQSSNNFDSYTDKRTSFPRDLNLNLLNAKTFENNLASRVKTPQNTSSPPIEANNNLIKTETNSNSTVVNNLNEKTNNSFYNDPAKSEGQFFAFQGENPTSNAFAYAKPEQLMLLNLIQNNFPLGNINLENINSMLAQLNNDNGNNSNIINNSNEALASEILNGNNNFNAINNFSNSNNPLSNNNYFQMNSSFSNKNNNNFNFNNNDNFQNYDSKAEIENSTSKNENNDNNFKNLSNKDY